MMLNKYLLSGFIFASSFVVLSSADAMVDGDNKKKALSVSAKQLEEGYTNGTMTIEGVSFSVKIRQGIPSRFEFISDKEQVFTGRRTSRGNYVFSFSQPVIPMMMDKETGTFVPNENGPRLPSLLIFNLLVSPIRQE